MRCDTLSPFFESALRPARDDFGRVASDLGSWDSTPDHTLFLNLAWSLLNYVTRIRGSMTIRQRSDCHV